MTSVIKRHPLVTFFVLAYALSWGNYFLSRASPNFPFLFPFGPLLATIIVASVTRGMDGLKDLLSRCVRWRVGHRWYVAALFVPVGIALAAAFLNSLLGARSDATQIGPWYSLFLLFHLAMIDAPLQEEAGWRGYALPRFPASRSPLTNTLILGALVVGWHLPVALGAPSIAAYMVGGLASAVLTNWVYYNARESALLAILYHTAQNTIGGFYLFRMFSGPDLVRMWLLWATVYAVVAAVVVLITGPNLRRQPHASPPQKVSY